VRRYYLGRVSVSGLGEFSVPHGVNFQNFCSAPF
jgi:hypothetical protein